MKLTTKQLFIFQRIYRFAPPPYDWFSIDVLRGVHPTSLSALERRGLLEQNEGFIKHYIWRQKCSHFEPIGTFYQLTDKGLCYMLELKKLGRVTLEHDSLR